MAVVWASTVPAVTPTTGSPKPVYQYTLTAQFGSVIEKLSDSKGGQGTATLTWHGLGGFGAVYLAPYWGGGARGQAKWRETVSYSGCSTASKSGTSNLTGVSFGVLGQRVKVTPVFEDMAPACGSLTGTGPGDTDSLLAAGLLTRTVGLSFLKTNIVKLSFSGKISVSADVGDNVVDHVAVRWGYTVDLDRISPSKPH